MNFRKVTQLAYDNKSAIEFLQSKDIIPKSKICSHGHAMHCKDSHWWCFKRTCRKQISIRKGTWFEGTKLPLTTMIYFIYWWSREMTTSKFCAHELDLSGGMTVCWNNFLRDVCCWQIGIDKETGDCLTLEDVEKHEQLRESLKLWSKKRRGTDKNFIQSYAEEFVWRMHLNGKDAFDAILECIPNYWKYLQGQMPETEQSEEDAGSQED